MKLSRDEWQELYLLRSELEEEEDRRAVRRLIRYAEYLQRKLERARDILGEDE